MRNADAVRYILQLENFIKVQIEYLEGIGIDLRDHVYDLEHVCLRVETHFRGQELLNQFEKCGDFVSSEVVGGRPIYMIDLDQALLPLGLDRLLIELPMPKKGTSYEERLEHVKIVIKDVSLVDFVDTYPDIRFETDKIDKPEKFEVSLVRETSDGVVRIKFWKDSFQRKVT